PLLLRQTCLLEYLTSNSAIFGQSADIPLHPTLLGVDRALLGLEARFSHQKRMDKIAAVFPRTVAVLGEHLESIARGFTAACPPTGMARLEQARQFHAYLCAHIGHAPHLPAYVADIASCELACAQVRANS